MTTPFGDMTAPWRLATRLFSNGRETPDWRAFAVASGVDLDRLPGHVAIIMDGNGRWAKARGLPRQMGHRQGVEAVREAVRAAHVLGVHTLTLYSFSSENWRRPAEEVSGLMALLRMFIRSDLADLKSNNVHIQIIGARDNLSADIISLLDEAETETAANTGLTLLIAFNYGGRDDIVRAMRRLAGDVAAGRLAPDAITESLISGALDTAGMADPDLLIRTSGEQRLSNFLIWQCAYAEFVFPDVLWPDFNGHHLIEAIATYQRRERRFGARPEGAQRSDPGAGLEGTAPACEAAGPVVTKR